MGGEIAQEGRGVIVFEGGEDDAGDLYRSEGRGFEVEQLAFDRIGDGIHVASRMAGWIEGGGDRGV